MDARRTRILARLAELIIILAAIFFLPDVMLGFAGRQEAPSMPSRPVSQTIDSTDLSASCTGGFANERTASGGTRVAPRGTPFNAYQVTLTDIGITAFTVYSVDVELINSRNQVFARHRTALGGGAGLTLRPGQSRQLVEAYGIRYPVVSCDVLSWQS